VAAILMSIAFFIFKPLMAIANVDKLDKPQNSRLFNKYRTLKKEINKNKNQDSDWYCISRRNKTITDKLKIRTVSITDRNGNLFSSLLYIKPKIHKRMADIINTTGSSLVGFRSRKMEIAVVKKIAIAAPWKNSKINSFSTSLLSDFRIIKKLRIESRIFRMQVLMF
jgi:hypothetical protein